MGLLIGYAVHDLRQFYHTYIINDLTVLKVSSHGEFTIEVDESHLVFSTIFCSDYIPQFKVGTRLKLLVYEDRGDCWSISDKKLGYVVKREEN